MQIEEEKDIIIELNVDADGTIEDKVKETKSEIVTDTTTEKAVEKTEGASEEDLSGYSKAVQERINKLTYNAHEAKRREDAAVKHAEGLRKELADKNSRSVQIDKSYLDEYGNRVKSEHENVQGKLTAAINAGDIPKQVEAQSAMAKLAIDQERLTVANAEYETRTKAATDLATYNAANPQAQQQPQAQQPVADPKADKWAEDNKAWFGTDKPMTAVAFVLHKELVESGRFDPTTDSYYAELNKRIRENFPHKFSDNKSVITKTVVAGGDRPGGKTITKVKITPTQVDMAKRLGVTNEQYAKEVALLGNKE